MPSSSSALLIKRSVILVRHRRQNVIATARAAAAATTTNPAATAFNTSRHDNNDTPTRQSLTTTCPPALVTKTTNNIIKTMIIPTIKEQQRRYASTLPSSTYYYETDNSNNENNNNNSNNTTPPTVSVTTNDFNDNFPNPSHPLDEPTRFLLNRLDDLLNDGDSNARCERTTLTTTRCNATLSSLLRWSGPGSAERADAVLARMERISSRTAPSHPSSITPDHDDGPPPPERPHPDAASYNTVLELYLRGGNVAAAQSVRDRMLVPPDSRTLFLLHLCRCLLPRHLAVAVSVLDKMERYTREEFESIVMEYARLKTVEGVVGAELAEDLLNVMGEMVNLGLLEGGDVSRYTFNLVVDAWAKSHDPTGAQRAEQIITLMDDISSSHQYDISPDKYTLNSLIMAYITSKDARCATHAEQILERMETSPHRYQKPDTLTYNTVMLAYLRSPPDHAVAAATPHASSITERIFQLLQKVESHLQPDAILYGTALSVLTSSTSHFDAMAFLERMTRHGVTPDRGAYSDLLLSATRGTAAEGRNDDNDVVLVLLEELRRGAKEGRWAMGPNATECNRALQYLSQRRRDDGGDVCRKILSEMESETHFNCRPNLDSYKNVMKAWTRSTDPRRAREAATTLRRLEAAGFAPDDNCYFSLFRACVAAPSAAGEATTTTTDASSLAIALEIHTENVRRKKKMGSKYYRGLYDVCLSRLDRGERRIKLGISLFKECCDRGVVDEFILNRVKRALPAKVLVSVLGDKRDWSVEGLPEEWSRNNGSGGKGKKDGVVGR